MNALFCWWEYIKKPEEVFFLGRIRHRWLLPAAGTPADMVLLKKANFGAWVGLQDFTHCRLRANCE